MVGGLDGLEGNIVWNILSDKKVLCYTLIGSVICFSGTLNNYVP